MLDKKDSARLTMGLNYWNFCTASFLAYCLAQASPSPSLEEKVQRGEDKMPFLNKLSNPCESFAKSDQP